MTSLFTWLTFLVNTPARMGAKIPGNVLTVFEIDMMTPACLQNRVYINKRYPSPYPSPPSLPLSLPFLFPITTYKYLGATSTILQRNPVIARPRDPTPMISSTIDVVFDVNVITVKQNVVDIRPAMKSKVIWTLFNI